MTNTYELTTKNVQAYEVVENCPDATDYVVAVVKGEDAAGLVHHDGEARHREWADYRRERGTCSRLFGTQNAQTYPSFL